MVAGLCTALAVERWLAVPFVEQAKAGCGSAAVAMVVEYWGQQDPALKRTALDMDRIDRLLPASSRGIDGRELQSFLKQNGFDAYVFNGETEDLRHHFKKGRPVIVCLAPKGARSALHYAVVVGMDEQTVWLNDSVRGKLFTEGLRRFEKEWDVTGHWALLAVPHQKQ
jgi:predicted double-glycine peptidase